MDGLEFGCDKNSKSMVRKEQKGFRFGVYCDVRRAIAVAIVMMVAASKSRAAFTDAMFAAPLSHFIFIAFIFAVRIPIASHHVDMDAFRMRDGKQ